MNISLENIYTMSQNYILYGLYSQELIRHYVLMTFNPNVIKLKSGFHFPLIFLDRINICCLISTKNTLSFTAQFYF